MDRPPRPRRQGVISGAMLTRPWGFLGFISAVLVMAGFFITLLRAGWTPGDPTGSGTGLNHAYRQATTVTWLGIVACQVGTAFAARTDRASLRSVGVFTNRYLLGGIAVSLVFAAALIYLPALHGLFGIAALTGGQLATVAPFAVVVWGAAELRRLTTRSYMRPCLPPERGPGSRSPSICRGRRTPVQGHSAGPDRTNVPVMRAARPLRRMGLAGEGAAVSPLTGGNRACSRYAFTGGAARGW